MKAADIISCLKVDHLGFLCKDIENSPLYSFHTCLGWELLHKEEIKQEELRVVILESKNEKFYIELIMPLRDDSKLGKVLSTKGEGFHHICYKTDNLSRTLESLRSLGVAPLADYPRKGSRGKDIVFYHPKDFGGILVEIAQAS